MAILKRKNTRTIRRKELRYMSEEEMEILKELSEQSYFGDLPFLFYADLIGKLIANYNKEKEKNKEMSKLYEYQGALMTNEYLSKNEIKKWFIPKLKVREKIEILEKHKQNIKPNTLDTAYKQAYCDGGIDSLNEIL